MRTISRSGFTTVTTEGAILPADLLQRIVDGRELEGLRPEDYHLATNERLNEAISRSWNRLLGVWEGFDQQRVNLPEEDRGTTLTRERWLLILLQELGYGRLPFQGSLDVDVEDEESPSYPISHEYDQAPLHLVTFRQPLDRADADRAQRFRRSPHSLLQEFLNRSDRHLWGIVSNGLRLRLMRDNVSFTRAAYLEFDLEAMMEGEIYADFTLLWLTVHQSRVEGAPESCWLEKWSQEAAEQGTRALDSLRDGVQEAISILGRGFLAHPANGDLRQQLQSGDLGTQDYYRQLLRLVYRLIFLFVAEDRNLLLVKEADADTREQYYSYYSITRLHELAARRRSGPHPDLYRSLCLVMFLLREGYSPLGLPGLGSYLFSERSTPSLDEVEISNEALLDAIRALAFTVENRVLRPVDYKNLGAEELGSVYESLLELHPKLNVQAATFELKVAAGSERKTTGSYYTPTSLINSLLDTALEPVVADRLRGRHGKEAEEALLDIKVVDPAVGSGHFLIAAANRLARHLARIRTGDEEPSPEANRLALRDVVRHCIHGVDINEMAVELCKVGLWLETLDPGKPLSFLERNIQCGNSLIGAMPGLLEEGIPSDAFKPITGDDKAYCREFKKLNREQRKGQKTLFKGRRPWQRLGNLAAAMQELDAMGDETVADVRAQEAVYAEMVASQDYLHGRLWADAWCAAFVWPKKPVDHGGFDYPITEEEFRSIESNPYSAPAWMRDEIQRLAAEYHFFHWHLAFPDVFPPGAQGGFDVILGNPPWERIKLQDKEWFASRQPEIASARNTTERRKLIAGLHRTNPTLHFLYTAEKRKGEGEVHFARDSGKYPLCGRGDVNTYSVFGELAWSLISSEGRVGIILPSGFATDSTTRFFFRELMETSSLVSLYEFENVGFFTAGHGHMLRFALTTLASREGVAISADFLFQGQDLAELRAGDRHFELTARDMRLINPNTLTCPIFRTRRDAEITKSIYRRIPIMSLKKNAPADSWNIELRRMIHLSDDSDLLRTSSQLETDGWVLEADRFVKEKREKVPVFEAKMVYQYNHRHGDFRHAPPGKRPHRLPKIPLAMLKDPRFVVLPFYWVPVQELRNRLEGLWARDWLLGWRDVTDARASVRTVISAIIPRVAVTGYHQIFLDSHAEHALVLCSNLSSFALDYVARQKVGGIHLTYTVLEQLPVLPPSSASGQCPWSNDETVTSWIFPRALELTYTAFNLRHLAQDCGYAGPPFDWDEARRFHLRCELDASHFHLYGIERDDVGYIMETFHIVKRRDEAEYGEYRTKRVILEIYDEMANAMATGQPYQTRLDPPPAHSDAAHLWDEEYLGSELPRDQWWQEVELLELVESEKPKTTFTSPSAKSTVKEPSPAFELKPPPSKESKKRTGRSSPVAQQTIIDVLPAPTGSRSTRLIRAMALGKDQSPIATRELVAFLADEDSSIRWLAGSSLVQRASTDVVMAIAAFLDKAEPERIEQARPEAERVLGLIADTAEDEEVRETVRKIGY